MKPIYHLPNIRSMIGICGSRDGMLATFYHQVTCLDCRQKLRQQTDCIVSPGPYFVDQYGQPIRNVSPRLVN